MRPISLFGLTFPFFAEFEGERPDFGQTRPASPANWKVEVFHKSLKPNAALAKSPARRVNAQSNHIFASIAAVFKMECLKIRTKPNHFALRSKLYLKAVRSAFEELQKLKVA